MEMRAFVLTFPLFSEYNLISKRKREREAGRGGEKRKTTVTVTVQSVRAIAKGNRRSVRNGEGERRRRWKGKERKS